jgi:hypothetical protein
MMAEEIYNSVKSGELAGSATAVQCPDVPCRLVYLKAVSSNAGSVFLGGAGVTVADGTTDITTGLELAAGEVVILSIRNLNLLYRICANAGDDLTYLAMG